MNQDDTFYYTSLSPHYLIGRSQTIVSHLTESMRTQKIFQWLRQFSSVIVSRFEIIT
jgi:hypothetical protein